MKINSNFWVACVCILPGKAVRRVNRTVPANISTNRSSVASPERARGEANGYGTERNPVKSIRSPQPSERLDPAHSVAQSPEGYLQSRQWWRWRPLGWKDVGGDTGRRKRKCVFFQVSCNFQLHLEDILFPVFMVCDDICLNDCDLSLYCINCCELPVFLFWRSSWPVSCPDLHLLHVRLLWLNVS